MVSYVTSTSGDDDIHIIAGYTMTLLLFMRLLWGLFGSDYGRFSKFFFSFSEIVVHGKQIIGNKPQHYVGHSPLGAVMVYTLLLLLWLTVSLGLTSQAWTEYTGPFWFLHMMPSDTWGRIAENGHEFLPNVLIVCIVLHVLGVFLACYQHRENLVKAMVTGYKK